MQLPDRALGRITRIGTTCPRRIGRHALDLLGDRFFGFAHGDRIVVGLGHLVPVQPRHFGFFGQQIAWFNQNHLARPFEEAKQTLTVNRRKVLNFIEHGVRLLDGLDDFEAMLFDVTDAIGKGFACLEFDGWARVDGNWLPRAIDHRPQTWFQMVRGRRQEIRLRGAAGRFSYFRHQPEGSRLAAYYDPEGRPQRRALLRTPLRFHSIAPEARAMMPPSIEVVAGRAGALYRRPEGAPVVALGDGVVRLAEETGDDGVVVELELPGGVVARHAHLLRTLGDLRPGVKVRQGQQIGLAGHSGKTATDRVRLELWREEAGEVTMLDPLMIVRGDEGRPAIVGAPLRDKQLERFKTETAPWSRALRPLGS